MRPDPASLPLLRRLHRRVFVDPEVRAVLEAGFVQLAAELETRPELPHATCTIPIEFTSPAHAAGTDQDQVRLCRLFLLRRGARMALPEQHTNSVQRLVSYRGRGWIHQGTPGGGPCDLARRAISSPVGADHPALEACWDIVLPGVWHYPEADGGEDWATVTFHSAAESEIVDEAWSED